MTGEKEMFLGFELNTVGLFARSNFFRCVLTYVEFVVIGPRSVFVLLVRVKAFAEQKRNYPKLLEEGKRNAGEDF